MRGIKKFFGLAFVGLFMMLMFPSEVTKADESTKTLSAELYCIDESQDGFDLYSYTVQDKTEDMAALGNLMIKGVITDSTVTNGIPAYGVSDVISFSYKYNEKYSGNKDGWNLHDDGTDELTVHGLGRIELEDDIDSGALIIIKSYDGSNWELAQPEMINCFEEESYIENFFVATDDDLRKGTYYRVLVLSEISKDKNWVFSIEKKIVEEYNFFICYSKNTVILRDIKTRNDISSDKKSDYGFIIDRAGSSADIMVTFNGISKTVNGYSSFCTAGKYKIVITNKVGNRFEYNIEITEGIKMESVSPQIYESDDGSGYLLDNMVDSPVFAKSSLTTIKIGYGASDSLLKKSDGIKKYGTDGEVMALYLHINLSEKLSGGSWKLVSDSWGATENENVNNIKVGTIGTGAVIVQTSDNGIVWETVPGRSMSERGLIYTSDFQNTYGSGYDILLYTPKGDDIKKGLYVRVLYAYEVFQHAKNIYKDYVEEYKMYLCCSNLDLVTLKNLSEGQPHEFIDNDGQNEIISKLKAYQIDNEAKSLTDMSVTFSGFKVDKSNNPAISYTVEYNGKACSVAKDDTYTNAGIYRITLVSPVGNRKSVNVYVDTASAYQASERYFGENIIISGQRLYSEEKYPTYKEGDVRYCIKSTDESVSPVSGTIRKIYNGEEFTEWIKADGTEKSGILYEGDYEITINSNPTVGSDKASGDNWKFTFRFKILPSDTDSSPKINQNILQKYAQSSAYDCYPFGYAYTLGTGGGKGRVTLIYSERENAVEGIKKIESNFIEHLKDGSYRYSGNKGDIKSRFDTYEDALNAVSEYAESAPEEMWLDMSDEAFKYTLSDELVNETENLLSLNLENSVYLFADEDAKNELLKKVNDLGAVPIVNDKRYWSIKNTDDYDDEKPDLEFVKDKYECDSSSIIIRDKNGVEHKIEYNRSIEKQLENDDTPTGKITIVEKNKYGDESCYDAVYFQKHDNTTSFCLNYYDFDKGRICSQDISRQNNGYSVKTNSFSFSNIIDEYDPGAHICITHGENKECYIVGQEIDKEWTEPGHYTIKAINRLGYNYSIDVVVNESAKATITINDSETGNKEEVLCQYGDKNKKLPVIIRTGYTLLGYKDRDGVEYGTEIQEILFKGEKILEPIWEAKEINIVLNGYKNSQTIDVRYGTEVELPISENVNNYEFLYWADENGNEVNNVFTVNKDSEYKLYAIYTDENGNKVKGKDIVPALGDYESTDGNTVEKKDDNRNGIWVTVAIIIFILISALCVVYKIRKNKGEKGDKSGE